jgi:hypothetical protein
MGTTLSTFLLLGGTLFTGVISSIAANNARTQNFEQAKIWSGSSAAIAALLIAFTLFIVVKGHTGAGEITGAIEEMAVGVMIAYLLLTVMMVAIAAMNILGLYESFKKDKKNAMWYGIGAASVSFIGFIMALVIIVFLL